VTLPVSPAEAAYERQGRALFSTLFRGCGYDFEAPRWDIRHLRTSQHKKTNSQVHFTIYASQVDPLPPRFANIVKAYVLLNKGAAETMVLQVGSARMLWVAVLQRLGDAEAFDWSLLIEDDLLRTEQVMLTHWSPSTTYKRCMQLQRMMRVLAAAPGGGIVRPMEVAFVTPRSEDSERYTLDGQQERMKKLPSDEAIWAVGDIYAKYAKQPEDRLIACVLAILLATALRIGEVLTLPVDCLASEGSGSNRRWGIRYHKEKSRGGKKQLAVRWMTPKQTELAKQAVHEVRKLTVEARKRARELEAHPDRVVLPGTAGNAILGRKEVARLLGIDKVSVGAIPSSKLPRQVAQRHGDHVIRYQYRAVDVSRYLLNRRSGLWTIDRRDGTRQKLSESLFIAFRNFFHRHKGTIPLLVDCVAARSVSDFLGGRSNHGSVSAFTRFGLKGSDGKSFKLHTHQFRHWVTTKAAAAGVPDEVIARWQGREHLGDLAAYKHLTPAERLATLKEALKSGRAKGRLSEMYFSLKEDVRDAFLEGQLQAVHVTPLGLCTHDFKVAPCPKMLNCVKDCDDYLFDTANHTHRHNLVQLRLRTELTLNQALAQKDRGERDLSENWIAEARATLAGVQRVLSTQPLGDTTVVRPFGGCDSRFDPLKET
jgi:hypothetical protein